MPKSKGFTLIELLVVIAVIGLLASIVLVDLRGVRKKARDSKGKADLRQIETAFQMKYDDNNSYPDLPDRATAIPDNDTRLSPYLSAVPNTNGVRTYFWYDNGNNQKFCVYFQLESSSGYFYCNHNQCGERSSSGCPDM
jgi:type II secretion system protein G